jgi:hypothetical protein
MNEELQKIFETMGYELSDLRSLEDYEWDLVFENISKIKNNNLIVLEAHDLYNIYHKKSYTSNYSRECKASEIIYRVHLMDKKNCQKINSILL